MERLRRLDVNPPTICEVLASCDHVKPLSMKEVSRVSSMPMETVSRVLGAAAADGVVKTIEVQSGGILPNPEVRYLLTVEAEKYIRRHTSGGGRLI